MGSKGNGHTLFKLIIVHLFRGGAKIILGELNPPHQNRPNDMHGSDASHFIVLEVRFLILKRYTFLDSFLQLMMPVNPKRVHNSCLVPYLMPSAG